MLTGDASFQAAAELWPLIEKGDCIAWIGSGLSKVVGYMGWPETVSELCSACGVQHLDPSEKEKADRLIDKAEECKKADLGAYHRTLASLFGGPVGPTRHAFNLLMRLPFKGYVTTNFDPLLCVAGASYEYHDLYSYPSLPVMRLHGNTRPIFYIHGLARHGNEAKGDNMILARSDFDEAYGAGGIVQSFLVQLLTYYEVLFIGCRLAEPAMDETFQRVRKSHVRIKRTYPEVPLPRRCVLLGPWQRSVRRDSASEKVERDKEKERNEANRFTAMGIEVIKYEPRDLQRHDEIEEVLEHLCKFAEVYVSPKPRVGLGEEIPS